MKLVDEEASLKRPPLGASMVLGSLGVNVLGLGLPLVILQVFDRVVPNSAYETLLVLVLGLGAAMVLDFVLKVSRIIISTHAAEEYELRASRQVSEKMLNAAPAALYESSPVKRFEAASAVGQLREQFSGEGRLVAIDLPFIVIFIGAVAWIAAPLGLVLLASFTAILAFSVFLRARQKNLYTNRSTIDGRRYSFVGEFLGKINVIKSNCMETPMLRRYELLQQQSVDASRRLMFLNGLSQSVNATLGQVTIAVVALVGGALVIEGQIGLAELAACTLLSGRAIQPMQKLAGLWLQAENASASEQRCRELLSTRQRALTSPKILSGEVQLERASIHLPKQPEPLFSDVSFICPAGESIAVTGLDGVGKTTLLRLLLGEHKPTEGRVLIDGRNATDHMRSRGPGGVAYLDQSPAIFATSILRNLTLSNDPERLGAALAWSNAFGLNETVNHLPLGYETIIGGKGATPMPKSALQVIAMVRALAMKPKILLFNEANSAMDGPSDEAALEALRGLKGETTLIMVTRRPSYVAIADQQLNLSQYATSVRRLGRSQFDRLADQARSVGKIDPEHARSGQSLRMRAGP